MLNYTFELNDDRFIILCIGISEGSISCSMLTWLLYMYKRNIVHMLHIIVIIVLQVYDTRMVKLFMLMSKKLLS